MANQAKEQMTLFADCLSTGSSPELHLRLYLSAFAEKTVPGWSQKAMGDSELAKV